MCEDDTLKWVIVVSKLHAAMSVSIFFSKVSVPKTKLRWGFVVLTTFNISSQRLSYSGSTNQTFRTRHAFFLDSRRYTGPVVTQQLEVEEAVGTITVGLPSLVKEWLLPLRPSLSCLNYFWPCPANNAENDKKKS